MDAIQVQQFGGPDRLRLIELPDPTPGPGEVRIAIAAAGVNRADVLARAGRYHRAGPPPLILGLEAAGTVIALGAGVTGFRMDQRVVAMGATNEPGFYAEQAVVPAAQLVAIPDNVPTVAAAVLPVAWLSAWYCLRRLADLRSGETVLVHAGASGVGSAAVQIALDVGARVIATAGSPGKVDWVRELGADWVLDSSALSGQELVAEALRVAGGPVDVVLDTVGGETFADSLKVIGNAGRVVAMANVALAPSVIDTRDFYPKNARILGFQITALIESGYDPRPDLIELLDAVAGGRFTVPIAATYPLAEAAQAHRFIEDRANRGKVVLTVG